MLRLVKTYEEPMAGPGSPESVMNWGVTYMKAADENRQPPKKTTAAAARHGRLIKTGPSSNFLNQYCLRADHGQLAV